MVYLDCESQKSALNSLTSIFSISNEELIRILKFASYATLNSVYKLKCHDINDPLLLFLLQSGYKMKSVDGVYWFHFTRHWDPQSFNDGLLPLSYNLNKIWDFLSIMSRQCDIDPDVIKAAKIAAENSPDNSQYKLRINKPHGPYAFLLGDHNSHVEIGQSHYFVKSPEIIMAMLEFAEPKYAKMINAQYLNSTRPLRVKFMDRICDDNIIATSLAYCKKSFCKNRKMDVFQNTCFDSRGTPIHKNQIIKAETFDA